MIGRLGVAIVLALGLGLWLALSEQGSTGPDALPEAPAVAQGTSTIPSSAQAELDAAIVEIEAGRLEVASDRLEAAIAVAADHPRAIMEISTWFGLVSRRLGEFNQALEHYDRALALAEELGDLRQVATILHNIGVCYTALGETRLALDALEDAVALRDAGWDRGVTLTAIATLHDVEGDHDLAMEELEEAIDLRRSAFEKSVEARRSGLATTLDRWGTAARNAGRLEAARRAFESSSKLFEDGGHREQQAIVECNLGRLLLEMGDVRGGLERLDKARPVLAEAGLRWEHDIALMATARGLDQLGELDQARALVDEALARIELVREDVPGPHLRSTFIASHYAFYELAVELAMAHYAREPSTERLAVAIELAERGKAKSLLDLVASAPRSDRLADDTDLRVCMRALEARLHRLEYRRLLGSYREAPNAELAAIEKQQRGLISDLEGIWSSASEEARPAGAPSLREMQQLLDDDTEFLVFALGEKASHVFRVARSDVEAIELPPRRSIETLATTARDVFETAGRSGSELPSAPSDLASALLPSGLDLRRGSRIVVVTDGPLASIPFAALPSPSSGRLLVEDHSVLQIPSISVLDVLRQREANRRRAPEPLIVLADPVYNSSDPRLPPGVDADLLGLERLHFSKQEGEAILQMVAAEQRRGLLGFDARRETILDGALEAYRIVHFGVHGELVEERPELTRLVLSLFDSRGRSVEGRLFMHEIEGLKLRADLVVLSACNSALGRQLRGEGVVGLTRALFAAGASRALVSLWYVDDRATAELMILFYQGLLRDRLDPAEALRQAQLRLAMIDETWRDPYYWAGFVLQGDWQWSGIEDRDDSQQSPEPGVLPSRSRPR